MGKSSTSFEKGISPWNKGRGVRENIICKECGLVFQDLKCNNRSLCSKGCRISWVGSRNANMRRTEVQRLAITGPNSHLWKGGKPNCLDCGKELSTYKGNKGRCGSCSRSFLSKERHYNWKGGITPLTKAIRNSLPYKEWRIAVFERDDYTCQHCGVRGAYLHADHIKPFALYPELRMDISNGRTLCVPCHKNTNTFAGKIKTYALV